MCVAKHAQITKNNKLAISLQHVKKEVNGETNIPKVHKKSILQCLYHIPKKVRDEVDLFDADKYQSFPTVDFNSFGVKVFYKTIDMIMKM